MTDGIDTQPVLAAAVTSTGTLVSGPAHLRGLVIETGATAGSLVLKDGGATGATLLTINTQAGVSLESIPIPAGGVKFKTDIHATLTNVAGVTAFHNN